uniref:Uncharacterized protein n=1 Tax=Corvus moneduloides TaxID=1196302 RepID=A0A8U7P7L4_CORMO
MASPAPWLRWTQTELTRWHGAEEEEEEEEDDFERRMDEDGVIGLGEAARSPPWGDSEDLEEGSPADEGRWHPRQDLAQEDEERGSSGEDEGPWGAESDGEPYPELSSEGRWGSGSSGSREVLRDGRALCQPRGCSTDGGDISGLSDTSPGPATPSRQHRGWGTAGDTIGGHRQEWTPRRSLPLQLSTDDPSPEPVPEPQTAGTGLPAPSTAGLAPTEEPRDTGNPPAAQGHDRSRVPKKAAPAVVPPKPARQSRSLSPRRRAGGKGTRDPSGTGTESTQYGRGRLNHPLPDLSKVEARVKFDQSYRPPRGRVLPARPRGPGGPIGFKSPAEIVREVLLSNGEGVPSQPPSTAALRQEFGSPRQATALVQQLQDDYHKLLTKYAEAENTIDQLRLGARVSLFSDPPQPSRSLAVGTVATGCRVMTLNIPQARTAALGMATAPATAPAPPGAAAASGPSERGGSPQPRSPPPPGGGCPACPGPCCCPGPRLTRALAGQSRRLQAQVESFESWMRAGTPTPSEQLQRMRMLKDAQDALEREYLRGRQQLPGAAEGFDPDRVVEGEIYRLGLRLEGLKERLEPGGRRQPLPQPPPQPRCPPAPSPPPVVHSPRPEVSWGCKGSPPHCSCGGCLSQPLLLCPAEPCAGGESPGDSGGQRGGGRGAALAPVAQAAPSGGGFRGPAGAVPALQVLTRVTEPGAAEPGGERVPGGGGCSHSRGWWPQQGPLQDTVTRGGGQHPDPPSVSAVESSPQAGVSRFTSGSPVLPQSKRPPWQSCTRTFATFGVVLPHHSCSIPSPQAPPGEKSCDTSPQRTPKPGGHTGPPIPCHC